MEQDDLEKRVAELERQLAEQKRIADLERLLGAASAAAGQPHDFEQSHQFSNPQAAVSQDAIAKEQAQFLELVRQLGAASPATGEDHGFEQPAPVDNTQAVAGPSAIADERPRQHGQITAGVKQRWDELRRAQRFWVTVAVAFSSCSSSRRRSTSSFRRAHCGRAGSSVPAGVLQIRKSVHHAMKRSQRLIGLGGAIVGIGVGLWGATRRTPRAGQIPAG